MKMINNAVKISCEGKDFLKLDELKEFQESLKARDDSDIGKIVASIKKYGFAFPFFIWKNGDVNYCLDGHGRLSALRKLDEQGFLIPPLPVVYVDCKDEKSAKDLLLRLNSQYGKMTKESVLDFIGGYEIDVGNLALPCGTIDFSDGGKEPVETSGDDEVPDADEKEEPKSRRGEMYELGNSILMCGDSTNEEDVSRLMGGEKAALCFTDPPYNVAIGDKNKALQSFQKAGKIVTNIEGDAGRTDEEVAKSLWLPAFKNLYENAKDECAVYVTMPQGGTHMMMMMMMRDAGWQVKHELVWVKNAPTFSMGRLDYDYQHEPILYGWKKTRKWVGKGRFNKSIWEIDKPRKCDLHPTMKPVALVENAVLNSSEVGDVVLDLFGGSGTTLIACEKNNRQKGKIVRSIAPLLRRHQEKVHEMGEGERQEAHKRVLGRIAGETMGGRGASSGLSVKGKPYGSEYHTVLKSGNIKFVKMNDSSRATTAPMETMTKNRVYVTISNDKNEPKFITYYDKENKRYKQIDLSGKSHSEGKRELRPPHTHLGYEHDENGTRALTLKERKLVDNVKKMWNTYING